MLPCIVYQNPGSLQAPVSNSTNPSEDDMRGGEEGTVDESLSQRTRTHSSDRLPNYILREFENFCES